MNERNHWITFPNHLVVRWGAFLPAPRGDVAGLVKFAAGVVEAGNRHAVYRPERLPGGPATGGEPITAPVLADHMRDQARRHGRMVVFVSDARPGPELWAPSRLACFRGGSVVEEEVGDAGELLRALRPELVERGRMFMRGAAPLSVEGIVVPLDYDKEVRVEFRPETDIWFPRVLGLLEEAPEEGDIPDMYDNRALANRHTPRLNAFLDEVRTLALDLGGRWEALEADPFGAKYAPMWNERGILL